MEMSEMVPAVLSGMSIAAVVLFGVWRMLAHYEKRNDKAHAELRDTITAAETRLATQLGQRIDGLDARLRNVEVGFARIDQRLETLERVMLPPASPAQ